MGKRVFLGMDASLAPAFSSYNKKGEQGFGKFNYIWMPNVEVLISKKHAVGVGYTNIKGLKIHQVDFYERPPSGDYNYQGYDNIYNDFSSNGVAVYYKYYFGDIPANFYIKPQIDFMKINYTVRAYDGIVNNKEFSMPEQSESTSLVGAKIEAGRDYMLFNFVRLSAGFSLGLTFSNPKNTYFSNTNDFIAYFKEGKLSSLHTKNPNDYLSLNNQGASLPDVMRSQLFRIYFFGFKFGISFLAF